MKGRRVLVFAPSSFGGMAQHTHYQARELASRGFEVTVLCRSDFFKTPTPQTYVQQRHLLTVAGSSLPARLLRAASVVVNWYVLAWWIVCLRPWFVLWEANSEYYAAMWAWPHILLRAVGVVSIANFHDPVRARGSRPSWWHKLTLALAYAPLRGGLIHGPVPAGAGITPRLVMREAPFGMSDDLVADRTRIDIRQAYGIPREAFVLLSFGHVADRKNLDKVIAALPPSPGCHLLVAGSVTSSADRPVDFYRELAGFLGVSERVHFAKGFIAEAEIASYFAAADVVCLTYRRDFVSQSGVLQIAALWDKPVLASGGDGPLRHVVERFGLGITIEPDSAEAIAEGVQRLRREVCSRAEAFARYRATTSWSVNIDRLLEVVTLSRKRLRNRPLPAETVDTA